MKFTSIIALVLFTIVSVGGVAPAQAEEQNLNVISISGATGSLAGL